MTDANFTVTTPTLNPGESFLVKYRLQPAVPFNTLSPNPITNDFTIPNLENGCYDFSIQKVKADGTICPNAKTGTFCIGDDTCCTPAILSTSVEDHDTERVLQINYDAGSCSPAPDSIRVYYKQKGDPGAYTMADGFITTPILISDIQTEFEGYIVGVCGETEAPVTVPFETECPAPNFEIAFEDPNLTITPDSGGTFEYKIVAATDDCESGTPIASGTITGATVVEIDTPGTYKVCMRRKCSETSLSGYVSSGNFTKSGGSGNFTVSNTIPDSSCDSVAPAFYTIDTGSLPIADGESINGTGGYDGEITIHLTGTPIGSIKLIVNGVTVECTAVAGAGFYILANSAGFDLTDTVLIQISPVEC